MKTRRCLVRKENLESSATQLNIIYQLTQTQVIDITLILTEDEVINNSRYQYYATLLYIAYVSKLSKLVS